MKKFLIDICKFLFFLVFVYVFLIIVSGLILPEKLRRNLIYTNLGSGHMYSRIQEVNEIENVDILFCGSSKAYRGFDTRMYNAQGYKCFNLGSSNQTPIQTKLLLDRYLTRLNPKKIIFEINPDIFSNDGVESTIDILSNDDIDIEAIKMTLKINNIKVYNTLLYSSFIRFSGLNNNFNESVQKADDAYVKGGYVSTIKQKFEVSKSLKYTCMLNNKQWEAFSTIVELLKNKNIEILLVQCPIVKSLYNQCEINQEFDRMIDKSIPYINFNLLYLFQDSIHFKDEQHLNQSGVKILNDYILCALQ